MTSGVGAESGNWWAHAKCRDHQPSLFFPDGTTGVALDRIKAAKAVCSQCDVIAECLQFALVTKQESGVWGGTSEEERRKMRRHGSPGPRDDRHLGERSAQG